MKNKIVFTLLLALSATGSAAQQLQWFQAFPNLGLGMNEGFEISADDEGNLYGAGRTYNPGVDLDGYLAIPLGNSDVLFAKFDSLGQTVWAKMGLDGCGGFNDVSHSRFVAFDNGSGQFVVTGQHLGDTYFDAILVAGSCANVAELFLASFDADGNCLWAQGASGHSVEPTAMLVENGGATNVFGTSTVSTAWFSAATPQTFAPGTFLAQYDAMGELVNLERVMDTGEVTDCVAQDGDWYLTGMYTTGDSLWGTSLPEPGIGAGGFVAKRAGGGSMEWVTCVTSDVSVRMRGIVALPSGKTIAYGLSNGSVQFPSDTLPGTPGPLSGFVGLFGTTGVVEWLLPITDPNGLSVLDIVLGPDKSVYLQGKFTDTLMVGSAMAVANTSRDAFIARIDTTGSVLGILSMGKIMQNGSGSLLANEQGVFLSGMFDSTMVYGPAVFPVTQVGSPDLFIAKFNEVSGFTSVGSLHSPEQGTLHIYANPNNGLCTIDLPQSLRATDDLVLSVYDNTGQLVQRVPLEFTEQGLKLDVRAQAKGIYHVELGDGEQRYTGTIVFE